ncbi:MAG: ATP-grasp domain-containing protein [Planctomycetota bacterium]
MTAADSPRPTRLAIVGASARAAAFSALEAGFDVVTADLFADADLAARCDATRIDNYPEGLADWLAEQDVDAWMYTGALENHPELVDRMAEIRPLWGNRGEPLRRCRDPMELQRLCREVGVMFPETRTSPKGLPLDGSWLCKTYRGACGSGVWALDGEAALARAVAAGAYFQRLVSGVSAAAVCLLLGRRVSRLEGLTEQLIGLHAFGAQPWAHCGSIARPDWRSPKEAHGGVASVLALGCGLKGLVGVDLVIDGDEHWFLEANPRFPASAEVAESRRPRGTVSGNAIAYGWTAPNRTSQRTLYPLAGKAIVYAKSDLAIDAKFHSWAMGEAASGRLADVPHAGTSIAIGHPVCTLLEPPPTDDVLERLEARAADVYRRLADCRVSG